MAEKAENTNSKHYDLEERTEKFAKNVAIFCKNLPKFSSNVIYSNQVIRSSGSVAANYMEANEALSRKDFIMRIKICRKEAKESGLWLRLIIGTNGENIRKEGETLLKEAVELKKSFPVY